MKKILVWVILPLVLTIACGEQKEKTEAKKEDAKVEEKTESKKTKEEEKVAEKWKKFKK